MSHEYPEDETDLTSEQFDALAEGGESVELLPSSVRMVASNGGASLMGAVFLFNATAPQSTGFNQPASDGEQVAASA